LKGKLNWRTDDGGELFICNCISVNTEITDNGVEESREWAADGTLYPARPAHRRRSNGIPAIHKGLGWFDWLPLIALPACVVALKNQMAAWVFMWALAGAIFMGCKWLTWRRARLAGLRPSIGRSLAYFFAWPGMDAAEFLTDKNFGPKRCRKHWFFATAKTACGAAILWLAAKGIFGTRPLLTGWMGMLGIILFLHFGLFELLALLWQSAGVNANPVMRQPLAATSLAEFWSTRWNTAFNALAHELAFRPLARKFGAVRATLVVFLISGLVHEIVISLPARGGFGLPTAYFVFQGIGVLLERSALGRRAGLGRGFRGWLFMGIWAGAPAFWLFHPPFVTNVILPMLHPIGAK
jgi:hypothetical protein